MIRSVVAVTVLMLVTGTAPAYAGPKPVKPTEQVNQLTTEQIAMNCALSGAIFSAATAVGLLKPFTVAIHSMPVLSFLHEGIYGCGMGVVSALVSQGLLDMLKLPPLPPPGGFEAQGHPVLSANTAPDAASAP